MSEKPHNKMDFLEAAKHQLAQASAEFEKALESLKDPERRKQLISSSLELLQKGLARAQDGVAKYQDKLRQHPPAVPTEQGTPPDSSPAAEPTATTSGLPPEPPGSTTEATATTREPPEPSGPTG